MNPKFLKTAELSYELKVRGLDPTGTVEIKRKILRGALSQESANRSFQESHVNPFTHEEDVKQIKITLDDLGNEINNFTGELNDSALLMREIRGRLPKENHCKHR